jgi:hypothetical protein
MCQYITSKLRRRVRKRHTCFGCISPIYPGESCKVEIYQDSKQAYSLYFCPVCQQVAELHHREIDEMSRDENLEEGYSREFPEWFGLRMNYELQLRANDIGHARV